jgi:hypothetical protein
MCTTEPEVLERDLLRAGTAESMQFHSDWNWLMDSIKKVLNIVSEDNDIEVYYTIIDQMPDIEAVFMSVSDFAKEYNQKSI